jgi:hypothetical protein
MIVRHEHWWLFKQCATVSLMRAGPSESACRSRFQTTFGGCGQKPWS